MNDNNKKMNNIKNIISDSIGVNSDNISIESINKKTKKKKKEEKKNKKSDKIIYDSGEGVEIINDAFQNYINFSEVRTKNIWKRKKHEDISNWIARDFVLWTKELYEKMTNKDWKLKMLSASKEINLIKDDLLQIFGSCDNFILRDYITFVFKNYLKDILTKDNKFFFSALKEFKIYNSFETYYDIENRRIRFKNKKTKKEKLRLKDINDSYLISIEKLVIDYGFVIAINFLIVRCNFSSIDALKKVKNIIQKYYNENKFYLIKNSTLKYEPYPKLVFSGKKIIKKFIKKVDSELNIDIIWKDNKQSNKKFKFLKGNK